MLSEPLKPLPGAAVFPWPLKNYMSPTGRSAEGYLKCGRLEHGFLLALLLFVLTALLDMTLIRRLHS